MFRAVITAVMETDVDVHYIDYGNYEKVTRSELRAINGQVGVGVFSAWFGISKV